ncbi:MarR family winged helix-turn-helix transcriptional regulator [Micromonospora sp. NPDC049679]|uniref:MarR family winged helix-turn-helix transcriptional regulator n=1 Tax=Micromonospora sp. NPDC049679 TaxID=3155920 RepID=UPI00340FC99A
MGSREAACAALASEVNALGSARRDLVRHVAAGTVSIGCLAPLAALSGTEGLRISEIAQRTRVDISVASRQITAMEAAGMAQRCADPHDRRSHVVRLTDKGQRELDRLRSEAGAFVESTLADWSLNEIDQLIEGVRRLRRTWEEALTAPGSTNRS